ncbi:MAG: homoserine O-acetyltransferase [Balneolales bacterium]|nr:homoserine O-acetyltransferase [Balneolales bacterium]
MSQPTIHTFSTSFITESGAEIKEPYLAYQTWGKLNEQRNNVIVVCHALTGNSDAKEWFPGFFDASNPLKLNEYFIICPNHPGSCYGSVGPTSVNPETGKPYQAGFPVFTIRDIVRLEQRLLDELKIEGVELIIGPSMGGMIALEFTIMDDRVKNSVLIAMGKAHSAWAIGISEAQRMALYADENWNGGFYDPEQPPAKGLAAARAMAMITYRSPKNYEQRFRREVNKEKQIFQVESYLNYQGEKLVDRFDANSYDLLTKSMDSHDVSRNRDSFEEVLEAISASVLVIGIDSDRLYPTHEQKELAALIPNAEYKEISSVTGHDAFLIEFEQLNSLLSDFVGKRTKDSQNQLAHETE